MKEREFNVMEHLAFPISFNTQHKTEMLSWHYLHFILEKVEVLQIAIQAAYHSNSHMLSAWQATEDIFFWFLLSHFPN